MGRIITNAARCTNCHTTLESTHRHDFRSCICGNVFVDGGYDYVRHGVRDWEYYQDLSEEVEDEKEVPPV